MCCKGYDLGLEIMLKVVSHLYPWEGWKKSTAHSLHWYHIITKWRALKWDQWLPHLCSSLLHICSWGTQQGLSYSVVLKALWARKNGSIIFKKRFMGVRMIKIVFQAFLTANIPQPDIMHFQEMYWNYLLQIKYVPYIRIISERGKQKDCKFVRFRVCREYQIWSLSGKSVVKRQSGMKLISWLANSKSEV